jgi:hypothetical protein
MSSTFDDDLVRAKETLDQIDAALAARQGDLPRRVEQGLQRLLSARLHVESWRNLLNSREAATSFASGLELMVDADGRARFFGGATSPIPFADARLFATQALVTSTWALADRVTAFVGPVLCTEKANKRPVQLVSHFVTRNDTVGLGLVANSIRDTYGWPVKLSYMVRNYFVHDGGLGEAGSCFQSPSADSRPPDIRGVQSVASGSWMA